MINNVAYCVDLKHFHIIYDDTLSPPIMNEIAHCSPLCDACPLSCQENVLIFACLGLSKSGHA